MRVSPLRVGFVSARGASRGDGQLWTQAGVARILDRLSGRFAQLHVAQSLWPERDVLHDHPLRPSGEFFPLPYLPSVVGGVRKGAACRAVLRQLEQRCDVVLVQLPFAAPTALVGARRPRVYHLCADLLQIVGGSTYYRGLQRPAALGLARSIDWFYQRLLARPDAHLVANGEELFQRYGARSTRGRAVVSATLSEREILSVPRQRVGRRPFRILYVGYLRHEKGIDTLLKAFELLVDAEPGAFELMIVGAKDAGDRSISDSLREPVAALQKKATVIFKGGLSYGPELFQCFADADALALPSLSEGTPRVLIEARAFGCPVVATRVGGIPSSIDDGKDGILFEPRDHQGLNAALRRLASDEAHWRALSAAGVARVRTMTVEAFADQIGDELEQAGALNPSPGLL